MSDLADLTATVRSIAAGYERCDAEQALVYACEDVVDRQLGSRTIATGDVEAWVAQVSDHEDLDPPDVVRARRSTRTRASAHVDTRTVCIRGALTTVSTVVHELTHISCGAESHRELFRDELVRLTRAHVSVDHAALLHALFTAVGLAVAPWPASASRR